MPSTKASTIIMPDVRSAKPRKITLKVSKKAIANIPALPSKILEKLIKNVDKDGMDAKRSVNAEMLMQVAAQNMNAMGKQSQTSIPKPIVNNRANAKSTITGVSKKRSSSRREVSKAINNLLVKFAGSKPSEIKGKEGVRYAKISVNTQILKNAMMKSLVKGTKTLKSHKLLPIKTARPKSNSTASSPKSALSADILSPKRLLRVRKGSNGEIHATSPKSASPKHKSPVR